MEQARKKLLLMAAALALLLPAGVVYATSTTVPVSATFVSNLTLTPTEMQFGNVSFNGAPGAADTVVLTTNSNITYNGVFSLGGAGTVAAGDVVIGGTLGNLLDVSCTSSGTLAQLSGSGKIDVNSVQVAQESAAGGGGFACNGIGNVVLSFALTASTDDQLKLGGTLDGATAASFGSGSYSTANAGGAGIQLDVVYQ
ncbi:MAG: hypothetical protein ACAH83_10320 [Alphaproteobacteria bacterium]